MSKSKPKSGSILNELTSYLHARTESVLVKWRMACEADETMSSKSVFSREEFNDQIPTLFGTLLQRLSGEKSPLDPGEVANEHGLHRWQSGYTLPELIAEIQHLFNIIVEEVRQFEDSHGPIDSKDLIFIHGEIFKMYGEANRGSLLYYHQLIQNDAAERTRSLELTLDQLHQLGKQRGVHLRQSSHDLRASFGIAVSASKMLESPSTEEERTLLTEMLSRNLSYMRDMLLQLTDYARIEAGHEKLEVKQFNVASLLKETIEAAGPLAKQHGLILKGDGPDRLDIFSDRVKVQRIVVNLLHNALKYTRSGGIYLTWSLENDVRWMFTIQDTGPGLSPDSPAGLLAEQLKPFVHTSAGHQEPKLYQEVPAPKRAQIDEVKESESLGLFIVKKLCELLRAAMDIESAPGKGTLIRIRFAVRQESHEN